MTDPGVKAAGVLQKALDALGGLPHALFDQTPDIVFFVFLPPILWAAAFFTPLREFKANIRPIGRLRMKWLRLTSGRRAREATRFWFQ